MGAPESDPNPGATGSSAEVFRVHRRRTRAWYWRRSLWRDARNLGHYGTQAPRWAQRIWLDPNECSRYSNTYNRSFMGQVIGGDWDLDTEPLADHPKFAACRRHWIDGLTWEETGVIDWVSEQVEIHGVYDTCESREDVIRRYRALDHLYERVKADGALKERDDVVETPFRERGGILIHIDRNGDPIFGNAGNHRLAIAQVLDLDRIPAVLGVVHPGALPVWKDRYLH